MSGSLPIRDQLISQGHGFVPATETKRAEAGHSVITLFTDEIILCISDTFPMNDDSLIKVKY